MTQHNNQTHKSSEEPSTLESAQVKPGPDPVHSGPIPPPTQDDFTQKIKALEDTVKEKEAKYLYLYAEFENFKKRSIKERSDLIKYGWENVARELLSVLDHLRLALGHAPANIDKNWFTGIEMVCTQFGNTLEKQGVKAIETKGQPFNPELHEALAQVPDAHIPAGHIVNEQTQGFTIHGRLLRPSKVVVSTGAPQA